MDAVYVLRPANKAAEHEEARYSVRSLVAAGFGYRHIWFAGARPVWGNDRLRLLERTYLYGGYRATSDNLLAAIGCPEVSDPFTMWNDDFFALCPAPETNFHRGSIEGKLVARRVASSYRAGALHAMQALEGEGIAGPLNYELHIPMVIHKDAMRAAILALRNARLSEAYKRSVYGNLVEMGGEYRDDVKVAGVGEVPLPKDWVSTSDTSFARGHVGRYLREQFPIPSPYEA